jgi:hypothetical protein
MDKKILTLALFLAFLPGSVLADSLGVEFNDYSAQIKNRIPVGEESNGSVLEIRGLYNNESEDSLVGSLGFEVYGNFEKMLAGIHFGAGTKVFGGESEDSDLTALALGGGIKLAPPSWAGVYLSTSYFFAPKIFSGLDARRLAEFQATLGYEISPKAHVFLGYGNLRTLFKDLDTRSLDEGFRLGVSLSY